MNDSKAAPAATSTYGTGTWVGLAGLLGAIIWSYWPTLTTMASKWDADPSYSHGFLVPLFAAALLWLRWDKLETENLKLNWWGLGLLALGTTMRLGAAWFNFDWFDGMSIIPVIAGICLLIGGTAAIRWAWPAIGFLIFMVPLPYRVERLMMGPLRNLGTVASTYIMQTLGLPAISEGNTIHLGEHSIGVAVACSGLRMIVIFFALSAAVALIVDRNIWTRLFVLASAVPIALISNITRITVTGILYQVAGPEIAERVFHDLAGWLMMPLGLALLWLELWLLSHLFIVESEEAYNPMQMGFAGPSNKTEKAAPESDSAAGKVRLPLT